MEFTEVVRRRRMIRRYRPDPVSVETIQRVLDAARRAPSAGYSQGQHFVVVTDARARARIAGACGESEHVSAGRNAWLSVAPVHIIPCVRAEDYRARYAEQDKTRSASPDEWDVPFWWVDAGCALMLLLLAAVDEGLGAGFLTADSRALRQVLGIPAEVEPLGVVTLGRPEGDGGPKGSASRGRRPAAQTVHVGTWDSPVRAAKSL
ncbi:MAG TPA: nitroreductase family protein [Egibacteraceae bacterium]|nr:nitroreductase family protein [Egibacteraceae bacterium]